MGSRKKEQVWFHNGVPPLAKGFLTGLLALVVITIAPSPRLAAQTIQPPKEQLARVMGTVTDVNGQAVIGAAVAITSPKSLRRSVATNESGFFELDNVTPGSAYQLTVTAPGFADWTSPLINLAPGQFDLLGNVQLHLATQQTTVHVTYNPEEIVTEQFKTEETQRVLGIIPNFYVTYNGDAEPLTTKMKFQLALKVSYDPVTIGGVAFISGVRQAVNTPKYGQGWGPYGERFGATAADGFTDIMIGGAILPSLLHQDPRYFYQGTGTTKSRILHAISSSFVARGDDGTWGPNYSSLGGDLASSAISNLYFPRVNRGAGLVFSQFALGTGERIGASLAQEFILGKLTHRGGHID